MRESLLAELMGDAGPLLKWAETIGEKLRTQKAAGTDRMQQVAEEPALAVLEAHYQMLGELRGMTDNVRRSVGRLRSIERTLSSLFDSPPPPPAKGQEPERPTVEPPREPVQRQAEPPPAASPPDYGTVSEQQVTGYACAFEEPPSPVPVNPKYAAMTLEEKQEYINSLKQRRTYHKPGD